jgi:hypothetical protein
MIELMAPGRPDGTTLEGRSPMTDNNELTPPGRPEAGTETGTLNPEGSRLEGMSPITDSSELRSPAPGMLDGKPPPGTLTADGRLPGLGVTDGRTGTLKPEGRRLDGISPITESSELRGSPPPGTLAPGVTDGRTGTLKPEGSRLDGIPPMTESRELRSGPPGTLTDGMLPGLGVTDGRTGMLKPEGRRLDGISPITESSELRGNPPPGTLAPGVTDGRTGTLKPEGSRLDGISPMTESRELRLGLPGTLDGNPSPGIDVIPDGRVTGRLPDGRPTEGTLVTEGKPPGTLTGRLPEGSPPGRPLADPIGTGDASQTLIAFGPPPACDGSPELGVVHSEALGSPATVWGGVLPQ